MANGLTSFSEKHVPKINQTMLNGIVMNTKEKNLQASMNYSVEAGGKRIRPILFLATLMSLKQPIDDNAYKVAGALEMIHTYSLIHDDLPAMDNDDLRRGKPTNHVVFGEGMAILAGDALLTEAIYLLTTTTYSPELKVTLIQMLTKAAGSAGMIGGQVGDIEGENQALGLSDLQFVHERKTGALIEFAVLAASRVANSPTKVIDYLEVYSRSFGVAFQIKDDLLDVIGDESVIGKRTGMDAALNKSTYTSLLGVSGAQEALRDYCERGTTAIQFNEGLGFKNEGSELLKELLENLLK